jgi:hypothetical protein
MSLVFARTIAVFGTALLMLPCAREMSAVQLQQMPGPSVVTVAGCDVEPAEYDGWPAQRVTNRWLQLFFVPKLGGRLLQVSFAGHPFLFVNPKYRGQYFPPVGGTREWFNYGGDKIWPMPEGSQDNQHWPGPISDELDDGDYAFHVVSQGVECVVRLEGPPDAATGLQYTREIGISADSPEISFHATMKNASDHPIRWSVQSVTQYDTANASNMTTFNHDFWAFTPANPKSAYLDAYHVRSGLADDPSFSVKGDLFALHWLDLQAEVWVDSTAGWIAVADGASRYAMVERFDFEASAEYPGKATVIFYKNGPAVDVDRNGVAVIRTSPEDAPFYMEAELNSPMVKLAPGESYTFKTRWFPTRVGSNFKTETEAGVIAEPLSAGVTGEGLKLSGRFGVFYAGKLVARFTSSDGRELASVALQGVDPSQEVTLSREVRAPAETAKVSIHVVDAKGADRGSLGEVQVNGNTGNW